MITSMITSFMCGGIIGILHVAFAMGLNKFNRHLMVVGFFIRSITLLLLLIFLYRTLCVDLVMVLLGLFFVRWLVVLRQLQGCS